MTADMFRTVSTCFAALFVSILLVAAATSTAPSWSEPGAGQAEAGDRRPDVRDGPGQPPPRSSVIFKS